MHTAGHQEDLVAAQLGLDYEALKRLRKATHAFRYTTATTTPSLSVLRDQGNRDIWDIRVDGGVTAKETGFTAHYRVHLTVMETELWTGSSPNPDWYNITAPDGTVIFEGEVEHPDNPDDTLGWRRYNIFSYIRGAGQENLFALILTKRLEVPSAE